MTVYRAVGGVGAGGNDANNDANDGDSSVKFGENVGDVGDNVGETPANDGNNVGETHLNVGDIKAAILKIIADNNMASASEITKAISVSQRTVERNIRQLRQEGSLIRHGSARGGHWIVRVES